MTGSHDKISCIYPKIDTTYKINENILNAQILLCRFISGVGRQYLSGGNSTGTCGNCQSIAPFIFRVTCMPFNPMKGNTMRLQKRAKPHPQIRILDLGKAFGLPPLEPALIDGIDNIG